jgi:hypothetical protein
VRLEGVGKLIKIFHLMGSRTRDLPACSLVPQPLLISDLVLLGLPIQLDGLEQQYSLCNNIHTPNIGDAMQSEGEVPECSFV